MYTQTIAPMVNNSNHVQNSENVNTVYKTSNLSMFKSVDGNRVPNLQHIRRLSSSITDYGMKCNPIIVNEKFEVIDGQHRLEAAKATDSFIYYIVINGYTLSEVHTLNLNQKNWTKKDFMQGYADMGVVSYMKLIKFIEKNDDYSFNDCVNFCSNVSGANTAGVSHKFKNGKQKAQSEIFEEGSWMGKDFELGQEWANKIRMLKPYYLGYSRSVFVGTMVNLFQNKNFDFNEFMHKIRLQPTALVDCANRDQYRTLIEDIYNYRSRNKVSLKY